MSLAKEVFYEYGHFLPKNHSYRTTYKENFNGKEENGKKTTKNDTFPMVVGIY
jgi:hypothetical protein